MFSATKLSKINFGSQVMNNSKHVTNDFQKDSAQKT